MCSACLRAFYGMTWVVGTGSLKRREDGGKRAARERACPIPPMCWRNSDARLMVLCAASTYYRRRLLTRSGSAAREMSQHVGRVPTRSERLTVCMVLCRFL